MLYTVVAAFFEEKNYSEDRKIGVGTVLTKIYHPRRGRDREWFQLAYEFTDPNISTHAGKSTVDKSIYDGVAIGDKIEVEFLASHTATHRVLGSNSDWDLSPFLVPMGLVFTLIGLALLYPGIRLMSRQSHLSRLRKHGVAITARPIKFICDKPEETEEKFRTYHIIYEYEGPEGETITGKSQTHSRDWFKFQGTDKNEPIEILADPKNPKVSVWVKDMR